MQTFNVTSTELACGKLAIDLERIYKDYGLCVVYIYTERMGCAVSRDISSEVVKVLVDIISNSPSQGCSHLEDHAKHFTQTPRFCF